MSSGIFIFLESSTTGHLFIRAARKSGLRPILLTDRTDRYRNLAGETIDIVRTDTSDIESVASAIDDLRQSGSIAGILSTSGAYAAMAATLSRRLGLPGGDPLAIEACQNKFIQRETLRQAGLQCPAYRRVTRTTSGEIRTWNPRFPTIVKPVVGSGSTGVRLCATIDEVEAHVDQQFRSGCDDGLLLEDYIEGPEFSVETIGNHVIGITQKHLGKLPYFVEVGHDFPAILPQPLATIIADTVLAALAALRLHWGPAHTELRLTRNGPTIIEVNPRMGGDMIPELIRLATGIDTVSQTIRLVTGRKLDLDVQSSRHASIRFLTPVDDGTLHWQVDLERALAIPNVSEVELYTGDGAYLHRLGDYRDRIGHIIATAETQHHVEVSLNAALAHLRYHIDPQS